jgi:hypothetical protein
MRHAGRWSAVVGACVALSAAAATPVNAASVEINGAPLNVASDDTGFLQVTFDGSVTGEFTPRPAGLGLAGFTAALQLAPPTSNFTVYGVHGGLPFTRTGAQPPTVTGDGSVGNPFVATANYDALNPQQVPIVHVTQRLTYVNGSTDVMATYNVYRPTVGAAGLPARFYATADLFVAGNDTGAGVFATGPPREVGAVHPLLTGSARLIEISPWTHYQEAAYSTIANTASNASTSAPGFADTVDPANVDAAAGVQWDFADVPVAPGVTVSVLWRFTRTSPLDVVAATPTQALGQLATVKVTARNADGSPDAARAVRYAITGANPTAGAVTTAADGTASISWTGTKLGTDTLTAFVDRDGNGVRDVNTEPQQTATVTWTPPPPPVPGKSVVAKVVSGQVFIKLPGSGRARASGPAKGFVPFQGAANIPVGSQLDTKKGRIALTSAADTGGAKTQTSDFYQGIFQVKQTLPKKKPSKPTALTTDIVMKGQIPRSQCAPLKGGARAAATKKKKGPKAVLGKLWGNGKGKFRTNGKYSAATVRGTIWLVEDRCEGTFTKVVRGTVRVRDNRRKKTVTVKAGHTYLARAQRAASKSRSNR